MQIQESGEMYLETILLLSKKGSVRSLDIAEYMEYSKPSVSRAVNILKNAGYISVDKSGYITLTETGHERAAKIYERHTMLSESCSCSESARKQPPRTPAKWSIL